MKYDYISCAYANQRKGRIFEMGQKMFAVRSLSLPRFLTPAVTEVFVQIGRISPDLYRAPLFLLE